MQLKRERERIEQERRQKEEAEIQARKDEEARKRKVAQENFYANQKIYDT